MPDSIMPWCLKGFRPVSDLTNRVPFGSRMAACSPRSIPSALSWRKGEHHADLSGLPDQWKQSRFLVPGDQRGAVRGSLGGRAPVRRRLRCGSLVSRSQDRAARAREKIINDAIVRAGTDLDGGITSLKLSQKYRNDRSALRFCSISFVEKCNVEPRYPGRNSPVSHAGSR